MWGIFDSLVNVCKSGIYNVGGGVCNWGSEVDGVERVGSLGAVFVVRRSELMEVF